MTDGYIRREDAVKASLEFTVEYLGGAFDEGLQKELKNNLESLEPVDVVPVRHARWERYSGITIRCSRCEHVIHDWRLSECKYCPNCGAKMDGEE